AYPSAVMPAAPCAPCCRRRLTRAGAQVGHVLGGSILIGTVFGWPRLDRLVFEALLRRDDVPVPVGVLLISSMLVVVASLLVERLGFWLDPRILQRWRGRLLARPEVLCRFASNRTVVLSLLVLLLTLGTGLPGPGW
ncbi:MAG: hypothetical protein ACRYHQ_35440, partial [Janthinobacterium lividum]